MYTFVTPIWSHAQFSPQLSSAGVESVVVLLREIELLVEVVRLSHRNWRKTTGEMDRNLQNPRENMEKCGIQEKINGKTEEKIRYAGWKPQRKLRTKMRVIKLQESGIIS